MSVYYYTAERTISSEIILTSLIEHQCNNIYSKIYNIEIIDHLYDSPIRSGDLLILYASNSNDLDFYIKNIEILENYRIILILFQYNEEIIRKAHLLHPRYIEFIHNGITRIIMVINKIISGSNLPSEIITDSQLPCLYGQNEVHHEKLQLH